MRFAQRTNGQKCWAASVRFALLGPESRQSASHQSVPFSPCACGQDTRSRPAAVGPKSCPTATAQLQSFPRSCHLSRYRSCDAPNYLKKASAIEFWKVRSGLHPDVRIGSAGGVVHAWHDHGRLLPRSDAFLPDRPRTQRSVALHLDRHATSQCRYVDHASSRAAEVTSPN